MKSLIATESPGSRFCLGAVTPKIAWFVASLARTIYLGALWYIVGILPVQRSYEGRNGTVTLVKISCGQCSLDECPHCGPLGLHCRWGQ